jgi:hypothetical protein
MRAAVALVLCLGFAACGGGGDDPPPRAAPLPRGLVATPPLLLRTCAHERIPCPHLWPRRRGRELLSRSRVQVFRDEPGTVLIDVSNGVGGIFHVIVGEQAGPIPPAAKGLRFPMRTRTIPMKGGGRFTVARAPRRLLTTRIGGRRAAVFQAARYPQGGLHGGHVAVVWTASSGHGLIVSLHGSGIPRPGVVRLALAVARSVR